jgi:DNA-binding transcriptional MerR regulator
MTARRTTRDAAANGATRTTTPGTAPSRSVRDADPPSRARASAAASGGFGPGRGGLPPIGSHSARPVVPDPYRYSMADLERETGLSGRTVRYYITQGLLPAAHGRGPGATYDLGHLLRLRMILLLKAAHLPLDEIKARLDGLSDREIAALLEVETRPPEDRWRRIELHPDIELHVRERGGDRDLALEEAVDMIVRVARPAIDDLERGR